MPVPVVATALTALVGAAAGLDAVAGYGPGSRLVVALVVYGTTLAAAIACGVWFGRNPSGPR